MRDSVSAGWECRLRREQHDDQSFRVNVLDRQGDAGRVQALVSNTYSTLGFEDEYTSDRPYWTIFLEARMSLMLLQCSHFR